MESLSEEERMVLKGMRKELCAELKEKTEEGLLGKVLKLLRVQCSPKWEKLEDEERAEILGPLYHALVKLGKAQALEELGEVEGAQLLYSIAEASLADAEDFAVLYGVLDE